jgi:hypothetical protein
VQTGEDSSTVDSGQGGVMNEVGDHGVAEHGREARAASRPSTTRQVLEADAPGSDRGGRPLKVRSQLRTGADHCCKDKSCASSA